MGLEYCLNSTLVYAPCYDKDEEGYVAGFCFACSQPPIRKSTVTTASR